MFAKSFSAIALCGMLASSVGAHMVITSPVPYGIDSLTNSPLINDGSDFPCKQRTGVYDISTMNHMPVGVPQTLSFKGGATHGGGSCQVSVTLDKEPTKDSQWKTIHSIIGGCPSNVTGNLSEDADGTNASVFEFSVPKGMPNGQYSLAWSWFNKIGNREMYMNCAPITVTGGASDNKVFDTLPDMFVINIPNEECATVEGEDFQFPSPGLYAETPFKTALGSKTSGTGCASVTNKGAGTGTAAAATSIAAGSQLSSYASTAAASVQTQASTSAMAMASSQATASGSALVTITTMATVTGAASSAATSSYAAAPTSAAATASSPSSNASSGSDSSSSSSSGTNNASSGSCANGSVSCSTPGAVLCIGSSQFGLCDIDNCAVPQALADGTSCSGGTISKRNGHMRRHLAGRRSF
ncbi:hypothetical protein LTR36_008311 [Oleoguttula mirabilis]|uniref:Lytic polysaccharide monooxygenase n=1 Tax=Oleoguttula mirabilis TaxID=1507867 RepID=A0AAV9J7Q3_9PEZI|nr:hypothetical protein LTR36_008311 [Oleoguttula mirabilis]